MNVKDINHRAAIFLDRDGVINIDHGYVHKPEEFQFIEGVFTACRNFLEKGFRLIVITNQAGIARGYYDEAQFESLNEWMLARFATEGVEISGVYYCPHHPDKGVGDYLTSCQCRKPAPGMLQKAAKEHDIDLKNSFLIGDRCSDIDAGYAAGLQHCYMVKTGKPMGECSPLSADDIFVDLLAVSNHICATI